MEKEYREWSKFRQIRKMLNSASMLNVIVEAPIGHPSRDVQ